MSAWKTVRVFISSTFRDMHAERDHLVKVVFPALRERLEKHRIHLIDIDLRWGVTREQAENDQVLGLCWGKSMSAGRFPKHYVVNQ
jgi:telomerase protein component 1